MKTSKNTKVLNSAGEVNLTGDQLYLKFREKQLANLSNLTEVEDLEDLQLREGYILLEEVNPGAKALLTSNSSAVALTPEMINQKVLLAPKFGKVLLSASKVISVGEVAVKWHDSSIVFNHKGRLVCLVREDNIIAWAPAGKVKLD